MQCLLFCRQDMLCFKISVYFLTIFLSLIKVLISSMTVYLTRKMIKGESLNVSGTYPKVGSSTVDEMDILSNIFTPT